MQHDAGMSEPCPKPLATQSDTPPPTMFHSSPRCMLCCGKLSSSSRKNQTTQSNQLHLYSTHTTPIASYVADHGSKLYMSCYDVQ